jgi:hypothetical protein
MTDRFPSPPGNIRGPRPDVKVIHDLPRQMCSMQPELLTATAIRAPGTK